jgi:lambda family phage portal protein
VNWVARAIDRTVETIAPMHGLRRAQARNALALSNKAYDAADRNRFRDSVRDFGSGNNAVVGSGLYVRNMARHLDRNHDIVSGGLHTLAQNIIGATGIGVEPQPRNRNGDVLEDLAFQLSMLWSDFCKRPEVTWQHDNGSMERLLCRTWLRDGEGLAQELIGPVPLLDHGTRVPYSLEMIEPDLLPWDFTEPGRGITQGVQRNAWGRPVAYHLYKQHPGEMLALLGETKSVPAERMMHIKLVDRIGQVRGISLLASVLTRLDDLKDYEESERIAAKIAACFAAFIIKGDATHLPEGVPDKDRTARLSPGMVFDTLRPGESVGTVDTNRPNPNLEGWRNGQLRAGASGFRISFSSFAKNYNGTYSAQRQELVEQYGAYGVLSQEFIGAIARRKYERFAAVALATPGLLRIPSDFAAMSIGDAMYVAPQMPWINPMHEAEAMALLEEHTYMSGPEIIRRRGANPRDVLDQQSAWIERKRTWGIPSATTGPAKPPENPMQNTPGAAAPAAARHRTSHLAAEASTSGATGQRSVLRATALASGVELLIYGPIGLSFWDDGITVESIAAQLRAAPAGDVRVRINSDGGFVSEGIAIHNVLRECGRRVVVDIEGVAASISSLIAMAGDETRIYSNASMMLHTPKAGQFGSPEDMEDAAQYLRVQREAMAQSYARKTGRPAAEFVALMADGRDHWYTAGESITEKLADTLIDGTPAQLEADAAAAALVGYINAISKAPDAPRLQLRSHINSAVSVAAFASLSEAYQRSVLEHIEDPAMRKLLVEAMAAVAGAPPNTTPAAAPAVATAPAPAVAPTPAPAPAAVAVAPQPAAVAADAMALATAAIAQRNTTIRGIFASFREMTGVATLEADVLADPSITIEQAQARLLGRVGQGSPVQGTAGHVEAGTDERDRLRAAASNLLLARHNIIQGPEAEAARQGNPFGSMTLTAMAESFLRHQHVDTREMNREQIAVRALAQQTASDFVVALENTMHRSVQAGYRLIPFTWSRFCSVGMLTDYRPHNRYSLSSFSDLKDVNESGEYEDGSLGDAEKQTIQGKRKGRILQITPEVVVNDDLGLILRAAGALGQAAGRTIEKDVHALFALNSGFGPTMSDGLALFHANHANLAATAGAPTIAIIDAMRQQMASQMDPAGNDYLDITPALWVGPMALGSTARELNAQEYNDESNKNQRKPNVVRGLFRDVVDSRRMAAQVWYTFADPNVEPVFEVAFLDGVQTPTLDQQTNFRTDGVAWKVSHRYGVGGVAWRGAVRNAGG